MNEPSNIVVLRQPDEIDDPLTDVLRAGARQLLAQAVEIEVESFLSTVKDMRLADGRAGLRPVGRPDMAMWLCTLAMLAGRVVQSRRHEA